MALRPARALRPRRGRSGKLERVGANWTWDSELRTDDPRYYHWTRWIFLQLYRAGLAVRRESPVIWCPSCLTVLAFEQVDGDACERCGTMIMTKVMQQWFLRITAYADVLLDTLPELDWPEVSSRGNVVNPDEYIDRVGADNQRGYLLFCGPWEQGGDFSDRSLNGVVRFNARLFDLLARPSPGGPGGADLRAPDRTIEKVGHDIENLKFNTALAELMSLANWLRDCADGMSDAEWNHAGRIIALLLAPIEPFLAEELWSRFCEGESVHRQRWPVPDPAALVAETVTIPVQVSGRVCGRVEVGPRAPEAEVTEAALALPAVREALGGPPGRVVYVPGRIISLVRQQAGPNRP